MSTQQKTHRHKRSMSSEEINIFESQDDSKVLDPVSPNPEKLVIAVSKYLFDKISVDQDLKSPVPETYSFLDETKNWVDYPGLRKCHLAHIVRFLANFAFVGKISNVPMLISFLYMDRILEKHPQLTLTKSIWKRLFIGCAIVATKAYEEYGICVKDFTNRAMFPFLKIRDLNRLETNVLKLIDYEIDWSLTDYTMILLNLNNEPEVQQK